MTKTFDTTIVLSLLGSEKEFPVDFDLAWKWLGFSRKDPAKRSLFSCGFTEGTDLHISVELGTLDVPRSTEKIWLTIDCFKTWGMMANTEQGKQVRTYFLQCEKIAKQKASETLAADRQIYDELASRTKALPLPEQTLRSKIVEAVDNYCYLFGLGHQQVWTAIYRKLKHLYHYDASARLKASKSKRSKLEQVEFDGKLEELRSVAQAVLGAEI
jgi:phage anti-repressor protein